MIESPKGVVQPAAERPQSRSSAGYDTGRVVERVAAVTDSRYLPDTLAEMKRLDAFLKSGKPVQHDRPKGFYFNALV